MKRFNPAGLFLCMGGVLFMSRLIADEGMWTFDNPPQKQLEQKYDFVVTQSWLDHVRLSSVRFMDGGSGSFISPNGLVLTNHHVAVGQLQKMSTAERDFVTTGFYAEQESDEVQCADLEVNVLESLENVTQRIETVTKGLKAEEALKARESEIAKIENEAKDRTGLKPEVVNLYHGGEYWLYLYKRYTDVRLVMAPERQIAYFGGDYDNFTYPRYDLDMAFFRIYEDGHPIQSPDFLKWNAKGAAENELVLVPGHPGGTDRLYTFMQLEYLRDVRYPMIMDYLQTRIDILHEYMKAGPEQHRRGLVQLFGLENSKKAYTGEYEGLLDKALFDKKQAEEDALKKVINANPEWKKSFGGAWQSIEKAVQKQRSKSKEIYYRRIFGSKLYSIADKIVFYSIESGKPDADRLDGYHASQLEELQFYLFSSAPIYKDLEIAVVTGCLDKSLQELGEKDAFLQLILNGKKSAEVVEDVIANTKLTSVDFRKRLFEGGKAAVDTCTDPMIVLARRLEPSIRSKIEWEKKEIKSGLTEGSEKIARAQFAVYGKNHAPDATFTLRLTYGTVKGYPMNGTVAPYKTTLYGLYDRALSFDEQTDWYLPQRFWDRKDSLDLSTPVNFVSTGDIIGGNSGSPVINREAEFVGLIFDGNIESLPGNFIYDDTKNRAVSVHSAYIIEALRKLYDAGKLADEIVGGGGKP